MAARSTANERPALGSQDLEYASVLKVLTSLRQLIGQCKGSKLRKDGTNDNAGFLALH